MRVDSNRVLRLVPFVVIVILAAIFFSTAWFTIDPQERGVVLRFGRYKGTVGPGLHFKLPFGLDRVAKVPVENQLKVEFGFRTLKAGVRTQYSDSAYAEESLILTGDLNVADVFWVTQYRIAEPFNYLFKVRNLDLTFRDMNEAVMREVVGDHTITEILTTKRQNVEAMVKERLQLLCNQYNMGISITQVILQDVNPPAPVRPAFNEVNAAQQEKEKLINEAQQAYNKVIPLARGDADKMVEEAEGYAVQRVNRALGEANRFNAVFEEYEKAPEVTRQRIYLETMESVLQLVDRKIVIDERSAGVLPLMDLGSALKD